MRLLPILLILWPPILVEAATAPAGVLAEAVRHFHAQELDKARAQLLEIREAEPANAGAAFYLGRVLLAQGLAQEAVAVLEQATRLDAESSAYWFWLGRALVARIAEVPVLFKLPVAKRMRTAYEKAVELDPDNLEARVAVARYHAQAPPIAGGSPAMVELQLEAIRRRDPALAHVTRALIHEQLGRPEPAAEEMTAAVELDPESIVSWREAGLFDQRQERWDEAQRAFDEVLARAPEDPVALYQAARTAMTLSEQQLARAERALESYLRLEPGPDPLVLSEGEAPRRGTARQRLAVVYARRGRPVPSSAQAVATGPQEQRRRWDVPPIDAALVD